MKNHNPKVAIVGPFPPSSGGICTNIQHLLKSTLKDAYNFLPVQTGSPKYGTYSYFNEKFYSKIYRVIKNLIYYFGFLSKNSPDIVHINTSFLPYSFWRDSLYMVITKLYGKKILLQIHGGVLDEFLEKSSPPLKKLVIKTLKLPRQILVLSSVQYKAFANLYFHQRVKVIPNMIDVTRFNRNSDYREEFDIRSDCVVMLFVAAHFYKEKGVWEVLNAIPLVVKEHKKTLFILVGGGLEEKNMKKFCKEKGLQNYVRFTGHLFGEDITKIFLASDMFIFPTYYSEGFPLVILEAMSASLPILSTPIGAIPEVIDDGVNGFLVQPKDSVALAKKITQLVENRTLREIMGKNNKRKVKEKYALGPVTQIFDEIYKNLISDGHR